MALQIFLINFNACHLAYDTIDNECVSVTLVLSDHLVPVMSFLLSVALVLSDYVVPVMSLLFSVTLG
jgi:hypothetical protein